MKKIFLLALVGAITTSSFAATPGKHKNRKHKKAVKTEQSCPPNCPRTGCGNM